MPEQMGYPDVGCTSCGPKAKGSSHGQASPSEGGTPFGDQPVKDEYKKARG